jgi:GTP:adenosylcobinamide-phosphate guanylyltransferase
VTASRWQVLVLAAGRGPEDPMARAYGVSHKCLVPIGGIPMLRRVVDTLLSSPQIAGVRIAIDDKAIVVEALGERARHVEIIAAKESAARSAAFALADARFPQLVTTGDHPLLTHAMLAYFLEASEASGADLTAGLASRHTIEAAFPGAQRTYLRFSDVAVSGCNLFGLTDARARAALDVWHFLEEVRKKPWRLAAAFGPLTLARYLSGRLTLDGAFAAASRRLGINAKPILMPFAEAAVDVDKPADKELAERILSARCV